jgi:signal transduction histidine kinase/ligand-binding sensor domain-containing protein
VRHPVVLATTLFSILLALCAGALALDPSLDVSQYAHNAWKIRDGFAKGEIIFIAQTPDGYLWLGTDSGLFRFDGVRAVPWLPPGDAQLPSNYISGLLVARDGTLWIGTLKGLASYKDGKLTQYPELAGASVGSFVEDREQTVWFGVRQAAIGTLCAMRDRKIGCYGAGTFGVWATPFYEDHKGNLWVRSATGLWRWAPGTPERFELARGITVLHALTEDDTGKLLLGTTDGLKQVVDGKIQDYSLPEITGHFSPEALLRSRDGTLWIGTHEGLLHLRQGRVDRFSVIDGLSGDNVYGIFEDREGSVWVATTDGLDRFRDYTIPTISRNQGLSNPGSGLVLATADGSVWTGAADGLNRWANGVVTFYRGKSALNEKRAKDETKLSVSRAATEIANSGLVGTPYSLGRDDGGKLWVATDKGLFYFQAGRFVPVSDVPSGYTFSIAGDGHGGVWILRVENLFHRSHNAAVEEIPWSQFGHKTGRAMLPDRDPGSVWLGFYEGGLDYVKDGKIVRSYGPGVGLGDARVNHLRFGPNGGLWASTEGGLSRIKDERISTITQKNGLPCDEVHWSMEDAEHDIWLYMPCGLVRIARSELDAWVNDPQHILKTTVFDNSDGVRSVGVYGSAGAHVTQSPDGRIWFVPRDGLSVIDPRHIPFNKLPPPVHIEQITADQKTYSVNSNANGNVSLPPRIRDLQIDYTALSLVAPEKVLFRYKLEGWDRDWQDVGTRRQAFYSNLPPRNYRFRVMACNNSGVWNEAGASLDFSVAPAYYQTNLFRALCAAAFLAALWGLYQFRLRQLARQFSIRLEERVNERTRIARDLHDTMLQTFQGVLLKFHGVTYMLDRPEAALKTLEETIVQAQQAINEGREAVQGLRSSTVIANDLARAFATLGEELAVKQDSHNPVAFQVEVEGETRDLHPILRDEVYRIGCEAVRNAFQHSGAARIEVRIHYDDRHFRVCIRDNGKGIDPKVLDAGGCVGHYGLPGMQERAKLAGGGLVVRSGVNSGTEVEIIIPAARAYAKSRSPRRPAFLRRGA